MERKFTTAEEVRDALKWLDLPRSVWVEVSTFLLADMMERRFVDDKGETVRLSEVSLRWDDDNALWVAIPVFTLDGPVSRWNAEEAARLRSIVEPSDGGR